MFSNKTYDVLKWTAQYVLPAIGTFIFLLNNIWHFEYGAQILGSVLALDTSIGVLLGISSAKYQGDGTMIIDQSDPEKDIYRMELSDPLDTLNDRNQVIFKVRQADHMKE